MKVLVAGDSYARLDPHAGHWANKWCTANDYEVTNFGVAGGNHVSIVNQLFKSIRITEKLDSNIWGNNGGNNWYENDLIIYCMTNWTRASASRYVLLEQFVNNMDNFIEDTSNQTFENLLHNNIINDEMDWALLSGLNEENYYNDGSLDNVTSLYKSISMPWLARANLFAVETLILKCNLENIPLVLATTPGDTTSLDNFKNLNTNLFIVEHVNWNPTEHDTILAGNSTNHLSKNMHWYLEKKFNTEYREII